MVVVAEGLIKGDRLIKAGCLVRHLIIDGIVSEISAGTRSDDLAVNDINIPPQFIVLGTVGNVAQRDAEIKGFPRLFVKGVTVWMAASRTCVV